MDEARRTGMADAPGPGAAALALGARAAEDRLAVARRLRAWPAVGPARVEASAPPAARAGDRLPRRGAGAAAGGRGPDADRGAGGGDRRRARPQLEHERD